MIHIAFCTSPLKAVRERSGAVHILDRCCFDTYQKCGRISSWTDEFARRIVTDKYGNPDIFDVPCGRCINCRLNYARTWSQRCMLESKSWEHNWFVTLTYDDDHLPYRIDALTGEIESATLVPNDVRDFLKRLREYYRDTYNHIGIRFYMAGEYGDNTARPHYHLILFNLPLDDLKLYSKSALGDLYFNSSLLEKLWSKGHCVIGEVTPESVAYTARYCQKKAYKDIDYDVIGVHKEYVNMSRRPGIALPYLQKNFEKIYAADQIYLSNGEIAKPSRYFDLKAEELGVDIEKIKKERQLISNLMNNQKVDMVSRDYYQQLDDLEEDFTRRSKMLKRSMC